MISRFLNFVFGCRHPNLSFPLTPRTKQRPQAAALTGTYVVCLECGQEFAYSWETMRIVNQRRLGAIVDKKAIVIDIRPMMQKERCSEELEGMIRF